MSSSVLRSQQLHPLSEPTPTASCIILWALWGLYILSESTMWHTKIQLWEIGFYCIKLLLHLISLFDLVSCGTVNNIQYIQFTQFGLFSRKITSSAWAEINSKESVLLWCFARCVIEKQLCAQGHFWLMRLKLIHMPLLVLFMFREEALCSSTNWLSFWFFCPFNVNIKLASLRATSAKKKGQIAGRRLHHLQFKTVTLVVLSPCLQ